jgi:hypothetical protein
MCIRDRDHESGYYLQEVEVHLKVFAKIVKRGSRDQAIGNSVKPQVCTAGLQDRKL